MTAVNETLHMIFNEQFLREVGEKGDYLAWKVSDTFIQSFQLKNNPS